MERILSESIVQEITTNIIQEVEAGFDDYKPTGTTVPPSEQGSTYTADIAQQVPKVQIAKTAISLSLPAMIGFNQPMKGPAGFVFGLVQRDETSVTHSNPPNVPEPEDQIISRKLVETGIREVKLQMTMEAMTDIERMFGNDFDDQFKAFQKSGGEVWEGPNKNIAKFLLDVGMRRMANKINYDFVEWIQKVSTKKGSVALNSYAEITNLYGVIGELREALYKSTKKTGPIFVVCSPRISSFMVTTLGASLSNGSDLTEMGRPIPLGTHAGFAMAAGDITVFEYEFKKDVTGGMPSTTETDGEIIVGFGQRSGPNAASIYFTPYKEYLVAGGADYETGQSNVFFRMRTAWETNPLDTYDQSTTTPVIESLDGKSQFLMRAQVTFGSSML